MKNRKGPIIGIVVVILAVGGAVALTSSKTEAPSSSSSNSSTSGNDADQDDSNKQTSSTGSSDTSAAVATNTVEIKDYAYSPKNITVKVGTTVTWTNQDSVKHDVMSDNNSAEAPSSELLAKGESYSFTFTKAGTYNVHCTPHPYMKATITVTE